MHAGVGGVFGGVSGAIGGAVSEQMAAHFINSQDQAGSAKIGLAASLAAVFAGQDAGGMQAASSTATSAYEYNRRLHPEELKYLEEAKRGKSKIDQQRLEQAAKAMTKASAGVNEKDAQYSELRADEQAGQGFVKEQAKLKQIALSHGNKDAFKYGWDDVISDGISRNDEWLTRFVGAGKMAAGTIWAVGSGAASAAAIPATGGLSGFGVAGFGAVTGLNAAYAVGGAVEFGGEYEHLEGWKVQKSYKYPTDSYKLEKGKSLAFEAEMMAVGGAVSKGIGAAFATTHGQKVISKFLVQKSETSSNLHQAKKSTTEVGKEVTSTFVSKTAGVVNPRLAQPKYMAPKVTKFVTNEVSKDNIKGLNKAKKSDINKGRTGRQQRLKEIVSDSKASSADRGWVKQELNQIERKKRNNIRNPIEKDLAHKRGYEASKGYDYSYSNLQDRALHKLQHKYDGLGRKNKTPISVNE